jgi:hypothetical protein
MKADRLRAIANSITGSTYLERYNNLLDELDYSSRNGIRYLFDEYIEVGYSKEYAAEAVFKLISKFGKEK